MGDDLRQTTALKQTLSIFLTLLVFLVGGFVHASVDSSFRSQRPSADLLTVSESSITYNRRARLKSFITADGDLIQCAYDAGNNLTRLTYPDGKQVNYTYNARNLLVTVTDWSNRTTTYTYDRLGRLTGTLRPNGTANQIAHDAANQLTSIKETSGGKLINYLAFQYDAVGQIKSRLRAPLVNSGWQHPALVATYDDDNRLLTANGQPVTHDADDNMTRSVGILPTSLSTAVDLTYNSRNQLTSAAGITRDTIDPSGKLLVRTHPNGTKTYYVYGLGLLYEANQADATKTYHFDQVGSTLLRTDDSGKVIGQAEYSAYGLTTWKQGDMATPFLYNGQAGVQTDSNGLLNMRARYYSPYLCRFLNADPSGFSGGSNWFAYADGNPISLCDPFGLAAAQNDFWGQVGDRINALGESMFFTSRDPQGAAAAGIDRMVNGAFGGGNTVLGNVEPLKNSGIYGQGSDADRGGDFMAAYYAIGGIALGEAIRNPSSSVGSIRSGATLGEQFLIADDSLVHFSSKPLDVVKGIHSSDVFAFQFGEVAGYTPSQVRGLIGTAAAGGEAGGTRFMHVFDSGDRTPELRGISGVSGVSERVFDGGSFGVNSRYSPK